MMHKNIFYQGEFVGRLVLPYPKEPHKTRYYRHMFLRIAEYVELLYQNMGSFWHRESANTRLGSLLHHGCRNFLPEQICHPAINLLTSYDRKNNTELNRTLKVYIANQYNAVSTSMELCIARSTFLKRLARITELTGLDLGDLKQRVYLALSYELFEQYDALNHSIPNKISC